MRRTNYSSQAAWNRAHPEKVALYKRRHRIKAAYGITLEQYDEMVERQQGRCAVCHLIPDVLVIDHDHETGRVRGLLCQNCNRGIGLMRDDPSVLSRASVYLRS